MPDDTLTLMAVFGMIAATPVAESRPVQFDLVCSGTMTASFPVTGHAPIVTSLHERVRVDLERHLWCWSDCRQTYALSSFDVNQIKFDQGSPPPGAFSDMKFTYDDHVLSDRFKFGIEGSPVMTRSERCDIAAPSEPIP
jgi:hypothetical protein